MSDLFYRNPRLTVLALLVIAVAGFASFDSLPRQEDPTLSRRFGVIQTPYPGASALRVESMVTDKIESELRRLHEIRKIDSLSRTGMSVLTIELEDRYDEGDVDEIWSKVRDRLADATALLPPGAGAPDLDERTTTAATLIAGFLWQRDDDPQLSLVTRLAEDLEQQLRNLPGTRETELYGQAREEIRVLLDPDVLSSMGLTPGEVARAVARADAKVPAGQLRHASNDLVLEVAGALDSLERVRRIPLRDGSDGRVVRLGDVATVEKAAREPAATAAILSGRPGVAVAATMEGDRRVDRWAETARALVDDFAAEMPRGVELRVLFDQSRYTEERLSGLAFNLGLGAAIVVAVLFVMMGLRAALVVALALPLTTALVLAELSLLGIPLHQTSVTGLIIALGLLIDNAIVVVDDYAAGLRDGKAPRESIVDSVGHLFVPLLASTLTTALAFFPIVLMPGGGGEFVGPIAIGVVLSVGTSFVLAMTVIPAIAGWVMPRDDRAGTADADGGAWWRHGFSNARLTAFYRATLDVTLKRPWVGVGVSLALPIVGFALGSTLTEQFFPPNDRNQFQLQMILASQTSLAETREQALRARALVHENDAVLESHWFVGEAAPRVFYNMLGTQDQVSSFAGAFVTTESPSATEALLPQLQRELSEAFPSALVLALPFEQGPPFDAPIEVRLFGPELDRLRDLGEELRVIMSQTTGVTYTRATLSGGRPKLLVVADEDEAALAGLPLVSLAEELDAGLEGATGGSIIEGTEEIPVRVRMGGALRGDLAQIESHRIVPAGNAAAASGDGELAGVPLSAIATLDLVPELSTIERSDGVRTNVVQAFLEPYTLIASSLEDFRARLDAAGVVLPDGYRLELGGEDEQRAEAVGNLMVFVLPLLVVMVGTIVLSFDSFRFATVIFAVALLSVGLALGGVWLFGYPMGFLAVIGTMGLVGLAINGGIVVLSSLRASDAAMAGDLDETREVVVGATRHIIATTLTTVGGFLPLIVFGGRFWPPMATAIAGGVGGSAILSLYLVPSLFVWIARSKRRSGQGVLSRLVPRVSPIANRAA